MADTSEKMKQMEAVFVPRKGKQNSIEFAGIFEKNSDCDIHGNRRPSVSKRDSISFPIALSRRESDYDIEKTGATKDNSGHSAIRRRSSGQSNVSER